MCLKSASGPGTTTTDMCDRGHSGWWRVSPIIKQGVKLYGNNAYYSLLQSHLTAVLSHQPFLIENGYPLRSVVGQPSFLIRPICSYFSPWLRR